jgi:hypothetical protein
MVYSTLGPFIARHSNKVPFAERRAYRARHGVRPRHGWRWIASTLREIAEGIAGGWRDLDTAW